MLIEISPIKILSSQLLPQPPKKPQKVLVSANYDNGHIHYAKKNSLNGSIIVDLSQINLGRLKKIYLLSGTLFFSTVLFSQANVGVDETNPASKLSVKGNLAVGNDANYTQTAAPADGAIIKGTVGIGTNAPNSKAALDIVSNSKGMLFPRMNTTDRNNINPASAQDGLTIYNTDVNRLQYWDGVALTWKDVGTGTGISGISVTSPITTTGGSSPTIGLGVVPVTLGGTGLTAIGAGQVLIGTSGGTYLNTTLTSGSGINITSASGAVTIDNTGDINAGDDITTSSTAGGDISGPFSNLQINSGVVGSAEITDGSIAAGDLSNLGASNGQSIYWNGSTWVPYTPSSGSVTGSGTTNYLPKWTSATNLSSTSNVYDDGTNVGIGTSGPSYKLDVAEKGRFRRGGYDMGSANNGQIEVANTGTGDAFISFHREGVWGAHFGLEADNWFSTRGWSPGASGYTSMRVGNMDVRGNYIYGVGGSSSAYGALTVQGEKNGWGGISFRNASGSLLGTFMMQPDYSGVYNDADNNWDWYWSNGWLAAGTVPGSRSYSDQSNAAEDFNVAKLLRWKNYGSDHVIFDASQSTSPSGTSVNNTNPQVPWSGSYPTLMGWNGTNTYGVRVDVARYAETAGSAPGDNLGNHSATTTLSMNNNVIGSIGKLDFYGEGGNSGQGADYYGIYQESGAWTGTYPDLRIQFHTGIKYDGYYGYEGHRFYTGYDGSGDPAGLAFQIGTTSNENISYNTFRAPIMYDYNDGGYYEDPNGTTRENVAVTNENYTYGWFRNYESGEGLYNQATGNHFYSDGNYWNIGVGGGYTGLRLRDGHNGNLYGYYYADGSGIGILSGSGNWAVRATGGLNGQNSDVSFFTDGGNRRAYINGSGLYWDLSNPYINASSYFIAPGGAYFNSGTVYCEAAIQTRGGIQNDGGNYGGSVKIHDGLTVGDPVTYSCNPNTYSAQAYGYSGAGLWYYFDGYYGPTYTYHTLNPSPSCYGNCRTITSVYYWTQIYHGCPYYVDMYLLWNGGGWYGPYDYNYGGNCYWNYWADVNWGITTFNGNDPCNNTWSGLVYDWSGWYYGYLYDWQVWVNYNYGNSVASDVYASFGQVRASGTLYANSTSAYGDLAEYFTVNGNETEAGDIVSFDTNNPQAFTKAKGAYDKLIAGVISENPSVLINSPDQGKPVALTGRVKVKVSTVNGTIKIGDYITSSDLSGVGMKATEKGMVIGRALENYYKAENGKIWVLIMNTTFDPADKIMNEPFKEAVAVKGFAKVDKAGEYVVEFSPEQKYRIKPDFSLEDLNFNLTPYGGNDKLYIKDANKDGFTVVAEGTCKGFYYDVEILDVLPESPDVVEARANAQTAPEKETFGADMNALTPEKKLVVENFRSAVTEYRSTLKQLTEICNYNVEEYSKHPELKSKNEKALETLQTIIKANDWVGPYGITEAPSTQIQNVPASVQSNLASMEKPKAPDPKMMERKKGTK